ncbi:STY4534 family ICE replication protein [Pseudomonas asplenii]|uniref:STY4534 family ICE replication protein n=1 Tax=Pseudomonas asplenii TaxID=53407 RepID=UPI0037CAC979
MSQSSEVAETTYFNLHTNGLGYLNRIREVNPERGQPFLACTIAALNGPKTSPSYRYFDVTVSGSDAKRLIRFYTKAVTDGRKVLIGFLIGDLWTDLFPYTKGEKAGQTGVSLKGRLLFISWIKVDGQLVYQVKSSAKGEQAVEAQSPEIADTTAVPVEASAVVSEAS